MIPAKNRRGTLLSFPDGNPLQAKVRFLFPEDTSMPYPGFEPELTRLQAECHSHHTGWGGERVNGDTERTHNFEPRTRGENDT
ncbi:hypothetical protein TNCV_670931 [Trichonephila clavipes]|nr:hypothetical protein TNCV_670931 [Trichonephila clavipes]